MQRTLQNTYFANYILIRFPNSDGNVIFFWISREALDCFCKCSFEETNMQSYFQLLNGNHLYVLPIPQIKQLNASSSFCDYTYICCWFFLLTSSIFHHPGSKINFFFFYKKKIPFMRPLIHFLILMPQYFSIYSLFFIFTVTTLITSFETIAFQIIFQLAFPAYLSHWSTNLIMMFT